MYHINYCLIVSSGTFSVGIDWNYFHEEQSGLLFVKPKYKNLKQEIRNYPHINIKQYEREILPKAKAYRATQLVKKMKCWAIYNKYGKDPMPWGFKEGAIISVKRLISIILYTDYTDHSSQFTATFRKNNLFEPIQSTKRRHRNFYWMSRLLKETIRAWGATDRRMMRPLRGPFFCGMSMLMKMPEFRIRLISPTSTSCHIEVAVKFSGESGIVIEMNNNVGLAKQTFGMDVSWLSRFKEEDERYVDIY